MQERDYEVNFLDEFNEALSLIKSRAGLILTRIESKELELILREMIDNKSGGNLYNRSHPGRDAANLFLRNNYGFDTVDDADKFALSMADEDAKKAGYPGKWTHDFFKKLQEERHKP